MFRRNKYGAKRVRRGDGISFASKGEATMDDLLLLREKAGEIRIKRRQRSVYLTKARIQYIVDWEIEDLSNYESYFVEFKGFETDVWRIKRRLWKHYGPGRLEVWRQNRRGLFLAETIVPVPTALLEFASVEQLPDAG